MMQFVINKGERELLWLDRENHANDWFDDSNFFIVLGILRRKGECVPSYILQIQTLNIMLLRCYNYHTNISYAEQI